MLLLKIAQASLSFEFEPVEFFSLVAAAEVDMLLLMCTGESSV